MADERTVREVAAPEGGRVETGVVRFGDDWPGVFIRGDDAMHWNLHLSMLLEAMTDDTADNVPPLTPMVLLGLRNLLASCDARNLPRPPAASPTDRERVDRGGAFQAVVTGCPDFWDELNEEERETWCQDADRYHALLDADMHSTPTSEERRG